MTNPGRWISHQSHATIIVLRQLYADGVTSMRDVVRATGRSEGQIRALLKRTTGQTRWPAEIDEVFLTLPTRVGRGAPAIARQQQVRETRDHREFAERIERDQARIREMQMRHLIAEQEKYGLPKRGRWIGEMPA